MKIQETGKIGKRGMYVIPQRFRQRFGLDEGSLVIVEATEDGIVIKPAVAIAAEKYSINRQAEFLLSNAVDKSDYDKIRTQVTKMGINPDAIPHHKPA